MSKDNTMKEIDSNNSQIDEINAIEVSLMSKTNIRTFQLKIAKIKNLP